nr:MAG TPA: Putative ATP dependent Clp protease [Caudoviricetes sp.]
MNKRKFWNWSKNKNGRILRIDGVIAEEPWIDDKITPKQFKSELMLSSGDITLWINSPGGDVFAASQIYNMLMDYKGNVTVKIDGLAASAASVIAMSGSKILMSPVSQIMVHNPMTIAIGNAEEMSKAINMLSEIKESIINAYELKTNLPRDEISKMMDSETWMNARKAVELGFADEIMYIENQKSDTVLDSFMFSRMAVTNKLIEKLKSKNQNKIAVESLQKRLYLLEH